MEHCVNGYGLEVDTSRKVDGHFCLSKTISFYHTTPQTRNSNRELTRKMLVGSIQCLQLQQAGTREGQMGNVSILVPID